MFATTDGFHKITSIDNGGLRFDRDEMEFSHPCFQQGHPYLLEHIKRKIAHPKPQDDKSTVKVEAVNRMLNEVKTMRGRQDALDSRFSTMKQENEALWREVAILRQKHMKQQQIVNKVGPIFDKDLGRRCRTLRGRAIANGERVVWRF